MANLLHEATRLSDITFFYNLPKWMGGTVRGVTANIMVRRVDGLDFDTVYAKTGGGEDVDYCMSSCTRSSYPSAASSRRR